MGTFELGIEVSLKLSESRLQNAKAMMEETPGIGEYESSRCAWKLNLLEMAFGIILDFLEGEK